MKHLKRLCLTSIFAIVAGCSSTNNLNIVQSSDGEHVLAAGEFGEANPGYFSSVSLLDSTVSTCFDFERQPSRVTVAQSRTGEEIVSWSGERTFAWQHRPLGQGRTRRLTVTVETPSDAFYGSVVPSTTETWLAVLVDDHLVDLDEFLDGCASSDEGDRDERLATRRRPSISASEDADDDDRPSTRRRSARDEADVDDEQLTARRHQRRRPSVNANEDADDDDRPRRGGRPGTRRRSRTTEPVEKQRTRHDESAQVAASEPVLVE